MNMWFSSLFLVAGLFLSCSAQTVEECRPLITPLPTFEPVSLQCFLPGVLGNIYYYFLTVHILFKTTQSHISSAPSAVNHLYLYCPFHTIIMQHKSNFTCTYHSLPTCEGCLIYTVDSRTNNQLIHIMNIDEPKTIAEVESYRAFYLMAKESTVKHSDLEHAKKQAMCLGFTGEPDFIYNPENCRNGIIFGL
uniref:Uncharacterized protein n=1 Tax=Labrus bergylta TaxID=56723 RepID=A0A3Q3G843_9LABR